MSHDDAVLATLIAYFLLLMGIGFAAKQRTRDGADFFLAGRRMGPFVAALSASASSSSAWTLLGVSGFAFSRGLSAIWLLPACVGGFVLNWCALAPGLRRISHAGGALTSTEVLAGPAGRPHRGAVSAIASLIILVSLCTYVASQFQAAGKSLGETFEISTALGILIGSAIVITYTLLGGFWAASLTDTVQGLVMVATAVCLPIAALQAVGASELAAGLRAVPVDGFASPWRGLGPAAAIGFVAGLLGIGLGYPGQPHVVNRFMALREGSAEIRIARACAIGWAAVVYSGMIVLGLCARVAFPDLADGEQALTHAAEALFNPVLAGIMIAAVLSAVMSTADSQLLVAASSVTHDLGLGGATRTSLLVRSRLVVLALSAGAVVAALAVDATIFDRVLFAWAAMGCAFGPLLLVTVLRGPVSPAGTITSMLVGFSLSVGVYLTRPLGFLGEWSAATERVVAFAAALAVALAASTRTVRD